MHEYDESKTEGIESPRNESADGMKTSYGTSKDGDLDALGVRSSHVSELVADKGLWEPSYDVSSLRHDSTLTIADCLGL